MHAKATVTSKGQITIPRRVREELHLREGDQVLFEVADGRAVLAKTPDLLELAGAVRVPKGKGGIPWAEIRKQAWSAQTRRNR